MKTNELKKGTKAWAWWLSRTIYYTGREINYHGYNTETKDYTPQHYYTFEDACGAEFNLTNADIAKLEAR